MIWKPSDNQCSGSQHHLLRPKTACMSHSKFRAMLIVFFDIQDNVIAERVSSSQTVIQQHYIEVLTKLHECVRRK